MNFRDRLKELRSEKKLTQQELCIEVEAVTGFPLSQQRIAHWEKGVNQPDFETICKLADFFCVSVDYLIGHGDIRTPLTEYSEYKLNPTEQAIIDAIRSFPDRYGTAVKQLVELTQQLLK